MKTFARFIHLLVIMALLTSCITSKLWDMSDTSLGSYSYSENIRQFLITQDSKNLVVIGNKYHYIFAMDPQLLAIMNWSQRSKIHTNTYSFSLDENNSISGTYNLKVPLEKVTPEEQAWLIQHGFKQRRELFIYNGKLSGTRYLAHGNLPYTKEFNQEHQVRVYGNSKIRNTTNKLLFSPITIALDGTVMLGTAALVVVGATAVVVLFPLMAVSPHKNHKKTENHP